MKQILGIIFFVCATINFYAQKDSLTIKLDEIVLPISKVKDFSKGYSKVTISDSLVMRNVKSLTDILRLNSFLYFKEEGLGMVSSPSFRGTNASQTAVIWNGISINSQLNGQTDFNAISANSYSDIIVRNGGGSVLFGSGAIGGSVHLNNSIQFFNQKKHKVLFKLGSFDTKHASYNFTNSNSKRFLMIGFGGNLSENDYKYLNTSLKNENGAFSNFNFDTNFGYKINKKNELKLYTNLFFSDRNLSRNLNAPSNDSYRDVSLKNLVEWNYFLSSKEVISSKIAYVFDEFKFFDNNTKKSVFSIGTSKRKIAKIDYNNSISRKIQINGILGYESAAVSGTNFLNHKRNILSTVFLLNHLPTKKMSYGIQFRKEFLQDFSSPFLYSFGVEQKFTKNYILSFNTSKNFRIPTFNDLYWQPGGNKNLKPEKSYQFEIGNKIKIKNFSLQLNAFYIKSTDLIQWFPDEFGVWSPLNINKTENFGLESSIYFKQKIEQHLVDIKVNYSYTIARDLETQTSLFYVPKHRFNAVFNYRFKKIDFYYQQLINDKVTFLVNTIPAYAVANLGVNYNFSSIKYKPIIGLKINNIYNNNYQNTLNRPMPGINFQITTNINF